TTNGPLLTSDLVRPRLVRNARSHPASHEPGAVDNSGARKRSGWSWALGVGADPRDGRPSVRGGWSWHVWIGGGRAPGFGRASAEDGTRLGVVGVGSRRAERLARGGACRPTPGRSSTPLPVSVADASAGPSRSSDAPAAD